jgi:hypothetical protein
MTIEKSSRLGKGKWRIWTPDLAKAKAMALSHHLNQES